MTPPHPAKFGVAVLDRIEELVAKECAGIVPYRILDPYAGVGRVHQLAVPGIIETVGVEIEKEWADEHPDTICGDSTRIDELFAPESFDAVITSPTFGNRLSDHHNAQERCKQCGGKKVFAGKTCPRCGGEGKNKYRRITYTHSLGRPLTENNSGAMAWGEKYRAHHRLVWSKVLPLIRPGGVFILNVKDHVRKGEIQLVTLWHCGVLESLGLKLDVDDMCNVNVPDMRFGQNYDRRAAEGEWVILFRKPYVD
jgi:hypothetical protein